MQRPTPPPVPPAVGADHLPVVIVSTRRPAKRRGRGGAAAAVSMLLAVAAVASAIVAWPYLEPSLRPGKRASRKKQAAVVADRGESPRVRKPAREEKTQQERQPVREPPRPTSQDRVERDREPADVRKPPQPVTLPQEADQPDARVTENVVRMVTEAAKAIRGHDYSAPRVHDRRPHDRDHRDWAGWLRLQGGGDDEAGTAGGFASGAGAGDSEGLVRR